MQKTKEETSRLRQDMRVLIKQMEFLLKEIMRREEIVKGTVYEHRRRCGHKGCRCREGQLHVRDAFSYSDGGRTKYIALTEVNEKRLREWADNYRRFRSARVELGKRWQELLEQVDKMEFARRVEVDDLQESGSPKRELWKRAS